MNNTKKILVEELKTGMYISDLNAPYIDHPFFYNHFIIENEKTIEKIKECGIRSVYIDPSKGMDEPNAPTYLEINKKIKEMMGKIVAEDKRREENKNIVQIHVREEIPVVEKVRSGAVTAVRNVLNDVRSGREIVTEDVMSTAVQLADTVIRCPEAIHLISSIKDKDDYTFQHSVSVCSLLVAFCNITGFDKESIYAVALGGLLHDVGKTKIDDRILKKPGRLTREEFEIIKTHAVEGKKILDKTKGISDLAKHITYEHHERYDGMGYPTGLKGETISKIGRMAAICDVYDAMSSERVYHRAMIPHETLRKIFEWSAYHFDRVLVEQFVHMMGIYPVGTLVMLESGSISIILQQNRVSLIQPLVRTFYNSFTKRFVSPVEIDLSKNTSEKIIGAVSPEQLNLNINLIDMLMTA